MRCDQHCETLTYVFILTAVLPHCCFWLLSPSGSKHKTMLEARSGAGPIKAYPRPGAKLKNGSASGLKGSGLQNKTFHCQICDVHVNSEIQLKQVETQREDQVGARHLTNKITSRAHKMTSICA